MVNLKLSELGMLQNLKTHWHLRQANLSLRATVQSRARWPTSSQLTHFTSTLSGFPRDSSVQPRVVCPSSTPPLEFENRMRKQIVDRTITTQTLGNASLHRHPRFFQAILILFNSFRPRRFLHLTPRLISKVKTDLVFLLKITLEADIGVSWR